MLKLGKAPGKLGCVGCPTEHEHIKIHCAFKNIPPILYMPGTEEMLLNE